MKEAAFLYSEIEMEQKEKKDAKAEDGTGKGTQEKQAVERGSEVKTEEMKSK